MSNNGSTLYCVYFAIILTAILIAGVILAANGVQI